jgi:isopenicillin N synthase-like dioxygenase
MAAKNTIPVIDLTPLRRGSDTHKRELARQIDVACTDIGFFIVTGHGISQDLIATARQQAIDFFALPLEEKMKVQRPPAKISRGYNWVGDRSIAYSMGKAAPPDIQEAFAFGPEDVAELASRVDAVSARMYAQNIWPERPAGFKQTMLSYYAAMSGVASQVLGALATSLGVRESYFTDKFDRQASVGRVIR